jgi:hypothetical protein
MRLNEKIFQQITIDLLKNNVIRNEKKKSSSKATQFFHEESRVNLIS